MKLLILFALGVLSFVSGEIGYYEGKRPTTPPEKKTELVSPYSLDMPPNQLSINGESWRVQVFPSYDGLAGKTECDRRIIWYDLDQTSKEDYRDTLWHEIVHAEQCKEKNTDKANWAALADSKDHRRVFELAQFLAPFVHDNPEFMKWAEDWK